MKGRDVKGRMPGASEQALSPPEPDPSDKAVADARELYTELENARVANRPVSLKLTQDIDLNQIGTRNLNGTRTCRAGHQTFICVGQGQSVTLWSDISAKLRGGEAENLDSLRIFRVVDGGRLRLKGLHVTNGLSRFGGGCGRLGNTMSELILQDTLVSNCTATRSGDGGNGGVLTGGGIAVEEGRLSILGGGFENCRLDNSAGVAIGGGLYVGSSSGPSRLESTFFRDTSVSAQADRAFGGGLGMQHIAVLHVSNVEFERTRAISPGNGHFAFGGGIGMHGGTLEVRASRFSQTEAQSNGVAWGGGLGVYGGQAQVYDSVFDGCILNSDPGSRSSNDAGGAGVGVRGTISGTAVELFNVSIVEVNSSIKKGMALFTEHAPTLTAAFLTLNQSEGCSGEGEHFLASSQHTHYRFPGEDFRTPLRLRSLSVNAGEGCRISPQPLATCDDGIADHRIFDLFGRMFSICGPQTDCTMRNQTIATPTPHCECKPSDESKAFREPLPSRDAERDELAPYSKFGCIDSDELPLDERVLNPNRWRPSNRTTVARRCLRGEAGRRWPNVRRSTPCAGGGDSSNYCEPFHRGPLCQVCVNSSQYYSPRSGRCVDCLFGADMDGWAVHTLYLCITFAVLSALFAIACYGWRRWKQWQRRRSGLAPIGLLGKAGVVAKGKVALGFVQIMLVLPEALRVTNIMPPEYAELMAPLQVVNLNTWIGNFSLRDGCFGSFMSRLNVSAIFPMVLLFILFASSIIHRLWWLRADGPVANTTTALKAVQIGVLDALPMALAFLFAVLLPISAKIFSVFSCEEFNMDDETNETVEYLSADLAVECNGPDHEALTGVAVGYMVFWPIGVPLLFAWLLWVSRRAFVVKAFSVEQRVALSRALGFLHLEYRPALYYWEIVEVVRKLSMTGFVFLIPERLVLARYLSVLLINFFHAILLVVASPYVQRSTGFLAVVASSLLQAGLLLFLTVYLHDLVEEGGVDFDLGTFDDAHVMPFIIFGITLGVLVAAGSILAYQLRLEAAKAAATFVLLESGESPTMILADGKKFHLFLSHTWQDKDIVAMIKLQLRRLLPGVQAFLDVDNLASIDELEEHVKESQAMLVLLLSPSYFSSRNCMRELQAAKTNSVPLILVHDSDASRGGLPLSALQHACANAIREPRSQRSRKADALLPEASRKSRKLEVDTRYSFDLQGFVFSSERDVVPWHRVAEFQLVSLARIAEQLLLAGPAYGGPSAPLFLERELAWAQLRFARSVSIYTSPNNPEANQVLQSMLETYPELLHVTTLDLAARSRWLVFLSDTSFEGDNGAQLAAELARALELKIAPLVVYSPEAVQFFEIMGATPRHLKEAGLYGPLALEWRDGLHRVVSEKLLAWELGARVGQTCESCLQWLQNDAPRLRRSRMPASGSVSGSVELLHPPESARFALSSRVSSRRSGAPSIRSVRLVDGEKSSKSLVAFNHL